MMQTFCHPNHSKKLEPSKDDSISTLATYSLLIHICQLLRLVCCDAGINDLLDVTIHDLI